MKKRSYSPEYKVKIVLEMLREEEHISAIAAREEISRTQLQNWKKEFLENAALVFSQSRVEKQKRAEQKAVEEREEALMKKVGALSIENDFLKKNIGKSTVEITKDKNGLSIKRQCALLGINRSSIYYNARQATAEQIEREEKIKARLDYWHTNQCCLGTRGLRNKLRKEDGLSIGRKLIRRYMIEMDIYAVYPKPHVSKKDKGAKPFAYLLKNKAIFLPNQVWAVDITYIKMGKKHMYLTAIIDWFSRYIVGWALSDTLETAPVLEALKRANARHGYPAIINSDQGSQFTSKEYIEYLRENGIRQCSGIQ